MTSLHSTIRAFPRGRSTEELLVLSGATFDANKRLSILAELDELLRDGLVIKGRDGKWRPVSGWKAEGSAPDKSLPSASSEGGEHLIAAPARFEHRDVVPEENEFDGEDGRPNDPRAVLRYFRSALRSDPRGSTTSRPDLHGVDWHLLAGQGPVAGSEGTTTTITVPLEALGPEFRKALLRREAEDNAVAIGWPLSVTRKSGMPVIRPVGMFSATWIRGAEALVFEIGDADVLVNPDWLSGAAREIGWSKAELPAIFAASDGSPLLMEDFLQRLREAAAGHLRGRITGEMLAATLDPANVGIYDAAAVFLPGESSFTARASADLDRIAQWSDDKLSLTALAPVLGLDWRGDDRDLIPINLGPLNGEQLEAVCHACTDPLSVVQGPPGTGKSQAIVSMVASVLVKGGTVLVASKNHQALDAVAERLGDIASDVPFLVRTLDPARSIDTSFDDVLKHLVSAESSTVIGQEAPGVSELARLARQRRDGLERLGQRRSIEIKIADELDRREAQERKQIEPIAGQPEVQPIARSFMARVVDALLKVFSGGRGRMADDEAARSTLTAGDLLDELRQQRDMIQEIPDLIDLAGQIEALAVKALPSILAQAATPTEDERQQLAEHSDRRQLMGDRLPIDWELARGVLAHRPLWLASILGTGKRIPLEAGLFDLVIFDEASQCDIASALPLMARARRAVVVGDDRQLSFIPQLGVAQDRNLMQAQGLAPDKMAGLAQSKRSLFDAALRVRDVPRVTLLHQYRSAGQIVEYISENFYGRKLVVAQPGTPKVPVGGKPGLVWTHVAAPLVASQSRINQAEVDAVASEVARLLNEQGYEGTIGAISPFRDQAQAIHEAVQAQVPEHRLAAADFRAGTVDGFQGQERDLILFSPVLGPASPTTSLTFVQKDSRRLNVAISRARAVAHVMGDLGFARSGKVRALASLASWATEPRKRTAEGSFDSEWEARVYYALKERGLDPQSQYEIAGRRLDFALFGKNGVKLDLEVDGRRWHQTADGKRKSDDLWRDQQMKALGWRVRRFWVDELARNMEACLDRVEQDLSQVD